jgi:phosphoenolpyruvate carboxykinase (GTP)
MCDRIEGTVEAKRTPIGMLPCEGDLDLTGLQIAPENMDELLRVDPRMWQAELPDIERHFAQFGDRLLPRMRAQIERLTARLGETQPVAHA